MKVYLKVPYKEKEEAKKLGAKWDHIKKQWYAPNGEKELIEKWREKEKITELVGEDREYGGNKLFVDLIPNSCWFTNVRTSVEDSDWDRLRKHIYERAGNKCECCKSEERLEAHERWRYYNEKKEQKLMRIIALCRSCHEATHMGFASVRGRAEIAAKHLKKVTGMNEEEVKKHIDDAFLKWQERNKHYWQLNIDIITDSEIRVKKEYKKEERKGISEVEIKSKG